MNGVLFWLIAVTVWVARLGMFVNLTVPLRPYEETPESDSLPLNTVRLPSTLEVRLTVMPVRVPSVVSNVLKVRGLAHETA